MTLPQLPLDKAMHVVYGAIAGGLGAVIAAQVGVPTWAGALALAGLVGVAKEIADRLTGEGTPDVMDAVATLAGGAIVALGAWA